MLQMRHVRFMAMAAMLCVMFFGLTAWARGQTPSNLEITFVTEGIQLSWQDNSDEEEAYVIQRKRHTPLADWQTIDILPPVTAPAPSTVTYIDSDSLFGLVEYKYRVGAVIQGIDPEQVAAISVNFNGGTIGIFSDAHIAGVVPMPYWNHAQGIEGTNISLYDSTGAWTDATVTYAATPGMWIRTELMNLEEPPDTWPADVNRRLFQDGLDNRETNTIHIDDIPYDVYDLIIYLETGSAHEGSVVANTGYTVDGVNYIWAQDNKQYYDDENFYLATATSDLGAALPHANYVKFEGLTQRDIDVTAVPGWSGSGGPRAPFNGFQIIGYSEQLIHDAPAPPDSLAAAAVDYNEVQLSWNDNGSNELWFRIERSTEGGDFEFITNVCTDKTTYLDRHLEPLNSYTYRVLAFNNGGNSAWSDTGNAMTPQGPGGSTSLTLLPENHKYLQYKGLPCMTYWGTHHWGWASHPNDEQVAWTATYANFGTLQCTNFRYTDGYPTYWNRINDDSYWLGVKNSLQSGLNRDVIFHVYFYDGLYALGGNWSDTDTLLLPIDDPRMYEDLGPYGLPGKTRYDVHMKVIEKTVQHFWDLPNIVFDVSFEIGATYDWFATGTSWWFSELKSQGAAHNPNVTHLCGTQRGGGGRDGNVQHPNEFSADFILGQHLNQGHYAYPIRVVPRIFDFYCPLLRMSLRHPISIDGDHIDVFDDEYDLIRDQVVHGIHSSETYGGKDWPRNISSDQARFWYLQMRHYVENIHSWSNEPGDEITDANLPHYVATTRPTITNPAGYTNGARNVGGDNYDFACIYTDADNDPPAQAEVWIDINGDGRYDPNPAHGERITMQPAGSTYSSGVLYTTNGVSASGDMYVFRFADQHWSPPQGTGVYHNNNADGYHPGGISYSSWQLP